MMYKFNQFINENNNSNNKIINEIKKILIDSQDMLDWEDFVELLIEVGYSDLYINDFNKLILDELSDKYDIEIIDGVIKTNITHRLLEHKWIILNNKPYDFCKGLLKQHMTFTDIYNPDITLDYRYVENDNKPIVGGMNDIDFNKYLDNIRKKYAYDYKPLKKTRTFNNQIIDDKDITPVEF